MKTNQVAALVEGQVVQNIRNGKVYEVIENDRENDRVVVQEEGKERRVLASATIRRNFEIVETEAVEEEVLVLTGSEFEMLNAIPKSEFYSGELNKEDLEELAIWSDDFLDITWKGEVQSGKGVLGSLTKKGLVEVSNGEDSVISLTEKGINILLGSDVEVKKPVERPAKKDTPLPRPAKKDVKPREKVSEAIVQERNERLQEMITELIPHANKVVTTSYTGYRVKRNFVEIAATKTTLSVVVRPDGLTAQQIEKLTKLYDKKTGWTLRAKYRISSDEDIQFAMELILASYKDAEGIYSEATVGKEAQ